VSLIPQSAVSLATVLRKRGTSVSETESLIARFKGATQPLGELQMWVLEAEREGRIDRVAAETILFAVHCEKRRVSDFEIYDPDATLGEDGSVVDDRGTWVAADSVGSSRSTQAS
jgi:hypothetical protein